MFYVSDFLTMSKVYDLQKPVNNSVELLCVVLGKERFLVGALSLISSITDALHLFDGDLLC